MRFKKIVVLISFLFVLSSITAQVKLSEIIQESPIVKTESNKLYFVDFWATWCGPCKYAKKILTTLQKQHPKDFYAISMSQENPLKVKKFVKKYPTELTIAVDYYGETFRNFNISSLPDGILFNAKGEKLWQGHPADLTPRMISNFLRKTNVRKPLKEFVKIVQVETNNEDTYLPTKSLEINLLQNEVSSLEIYHGLDYMRLRGSLSDILSHFSKMYSGQINLNEGLNKSYELFLKKPLETGADYSQKIINELNLNSKEEKFIGEAILLKVTRPNFWDTQQIDWQDGTENYLISETDVTANNVNLKEFAYILTKALDKPVVLSFDNISDIDSLHDWQLHYKFFQLMESNFADYGIEVEEIKTELPKYYITKKAP